jgi:hypothetical protein
MEVGEAGDDLVACECRLWPREQESGHHHRVRVEPIALKAPFKVAAHFRK